MAGFLFVNKPCGPTSHDAVDAVRRVTGERRVGHAGTLDPFASGLLIIGVGREATREFSKLVGLDKRYRATLRLGATSDTDDRTGRISTGQMADGKWPTPDETEAALKKFTGKIEQIPPMYSAKKIGGKKLYELARAGVEVARRPSLVEIHSIDVVNYDPLATGRELTIDVHCSSGTYIRSLARDIGEALPAQGGSASGGGCGAYLEELERKAIGPFKLEQAVKLADLNATNINEHLMSVEGVISRAMPQNSKLQGKDG